MDDEYHTIFRQSLTEIKVQGSRFIGEAMPVLTVIDAQDRLEAVRKREYAATHHCFAYRAGHEGISQFKYSDDGEPTGTAGRPIYDAICGGNLTDTLIVVTRYFGGTKLGTGGLAHAYAEAAALALREARVVTKYLTRQAKCMLEFPLYDKWQRVLQKLEATVIDSQFTDEVTMHLEIRRGRFEELQRAFTELTAGKGRFEPIEFPSTEIR
jgi:uncharacterized YigZ family protein